MKMYDRNTANYFRNETDCFAVNYKNAFSYRGILDTTMKFVEDFDLLSEEKWNRFASQYSGNPDDEDLGWRGEYWGKMMRGACFVYSYTKNEKLYRILNETVVNMLEREDSFGRISSYSCDAEFIGWDLWCRKYVLLGMQYFIEICTDTNLKDRIISSMCRQVDYIISKIGNPEEGKKHITTATSHWKGLNSSSILEPIVRLYTITEEKKYFDFAEYIVSAGGTEEQNIFELAYENEVYPYQFEQTKAYEMMSCFEGLLEFYRVTKNEKYKTAVVNFGNKILESDFTIIGCSGCRHERLDNSTKKQALTTNGVMQETCVTVTLMKFCYQLYLITGDEKYVEAFEKSLYNAYLGSVNTEKIENTNFIKQRRIDELNPGLISEPLPFDSYSPLTAGKRGMGVGGLKVMPDKHYYGCCACIGVAGIGLVPKMHIMNSENGFVMNLFVPGKVETALEDGTKVVFATETKYPAYGNVRISVEIENPVSFELKIRIPSWSKETDIAVNCEKVESENNYVTIVKEWNDGDEIIIELDMRTRAIYPELTEDCSDPEAKNHIALQRGPLILAQENRLGYSVDEPVNIIVGDDGYVNVMIPEKDIAPYEHILEVRVPLVNGEYMTVTDYASAGKLWNEESKMAAWILNKATL